MSLLSPLLVKLYIFNAFKLPLDADPFPALDGFCCCLPLNSLQFLHIILVTRCLGLTAPVQVHSVFGGSCFWVELKREAAESLKGNLLRGLPSESIISQRYFETGFRYGNESVCLAQKLFSTFKWERDGKGEERLSSSKALSTLGFFFVFPTVACTGAAQSTVALMTALVQAGKLTCFATHCLHDLYKP